MFTEASEGRFVATVAFRTRDRKGWAPMQETADGGEHAAAAGGAAATETGNADVIDGAHVAGAQNPPPYPRPTPILPPPCPPPASTITPP